MIEQQSGVWSEEAGLVVDWEVFQRTRTDLGAGFVRILGYFREDGEKSVAAIEAGMHGKDAASLVAPADRLKSEARQFGAEPLAELAEEIEFAARRSVENRIFPDHLIPSVAQLRPLYRLTMELFEREANPLAARRPGSARSGANNQDFGRI